MGPSISTPVALIFVQRSHILLRYAEVYLGQGYSKKRGLENCGGRILGLDLMGSWRYLHSNLDDRGGLPRFDPGPVCDA